jgi:hypothetical protein
VPERARHCGPLNAAAALPGVLAKLWRPG